MTTYIIHHNDLDGYASAGIATAFLARRGIEPVLCEMSYGQMLPEGFGPGDTVYMLDFALQPFVPGMDLLAASVGEFVWIDHHKSAMEAYQAVQVARGPEWGVTGLRLAEYCGAELTWAWFTLQERGLPLRMGPELCAAVPHAIRLVGDWDTWRHAAMADSVAPRFKVAFDSCAPAETIAWFARYVRCWSRLEYECMEAELADKINWGAAIEQYEIQTSAALMRVRAFEAQLAVPPQAPTRGHDVYRVIAANVEQRGSQAFASVYDPARHALMLGFAYEGTGRVTVSLYTTAPGVDCGALAQRCGEAGPFASGGGHAKAAGFQTSWEHLWSLLWLEVPA
jgi:hypothetical protein